MARRLAFFALGIGLIPLIAITINALSRIQDVRSRAANQKVSSVPIVIPAPQTLLTAPYIRLTIPPHRTFSKGEKIPIDIYVDTHGQPTSETRLVISYDRSILNLDEKDIENARIYPVMNIETLVKGSVIFSLFVKDESGYTPVATGTEQKVATMYFAVIDKGPTQTKVDLVTAGQGDISSITGVRKQGEELPPNLLKSAEGTVVSVN